METNKSNKKKTGIIFLVLAVILLAVGLVFINQNIFSSDKTKPKEFFSEYKISGNSLEDFDLYFLQLENQTKNKIYSPLSIKYALSMLSEGTKNDTKAQIDSVIGDYSATKYINSKNMSFANAMFIRETYKNNINSDYNKILSDKYNAEIVYDSFANANTMNSWVKNKTLNLIDNFFDDDSVARSDFIITNALAIDMEWKKVIQPTTTKSSTWYSVKYDHEEYNHFIDIIMAEEYASVSFNNKSMNAKAVELGADINNYDIVNTLGEENIRKTVGEEYRKWLASYDASDFDEKEVDEFLDTYIKEINSNYKRVDSSTDFSLFVDDDVKVFAKDLKEYDGTTLQYIGIMPRKSTLSDYIKDLDSTKVNNLISSLKEIKSENFKEGVVTKVVGYIPLFKFDYDLDLMNDLKQLGITYVFDPNKADLSGITSKSNAFIDSASHKSNIEFSNEGIKAAAVTQFGGLGAAAGGFEYLYEVPVEVIDLTFDNPYMFLIRDKSTGEVWFTGTVYEPIENNNIQED